MIYNASKELFIIYFNASRSNNNNNVTYLIGELIWGLIYFVLCFAFMITYVILGGK
jgi:hypothetical protein